MTRSKSTQNRGRKPRREAENSARKAPHPRRGGKSGTAPDGWLYGDHAVMAALANPARKFRRLVLTHAKLDELGSELKGRIEEQIAPELVDKDAIARLLPENAIHQGIALLPAPLHDYRIEDLLEDADRESMVIAVLDQVTDPHNVGAILRSAAAFNVAAIIVPDRHSPPITGVLAKAASGAVETVPIIRVGNLSRALDQLAENGFWRIGLDGQAQEELAEAAARFQKVAVVLGAEGKGLRQLTAQKCDLLAKLPISPKVESLNVSNAAAITFYELARTVRGS
jgi:23S rRNA (guanosine2251-2'-O)-methyltransferase